MKKKIYKLLLPLLGAYSLVACREETTLLFDDSPSVRIENAVKNYRELLTSAEHGWIMEYYPGGSDQTWGGYSLAVSFTEKGYAIFRSGMEENPDTTAISRFSIKKDVGPTLNFDTYNRVLHHFSSPDISEGEGTGSGLLGDYEFLLGAYTDSSLVMYGKKYGSVIRMYTLQEDAKSYLQKSVELRNSYVDIPAVSAVEGTFGGRPVEVSLISSQKFKITQDGQEEEFSFIFTDSKVKLYQPVTLNGYTLSELTWDVAEKSFVSADGLTKLSLQADSLGLTLKQLLGDYVFSYIGERGAQQVDVTITQNSSGQIVMQGLPFDVIFRYNRTKGALELFSQVVKTSPQVYLAMWAIPSLSISGDYSLLTRWNGSESNFELAFVAGDGVWMSDGERVYARAFILWDRENGSPYTGFDNQTARYTTLKLTKK